MTEDIGKQLDEIADLLRKRVELAERAQEYQEQRHRESEAMSAQLLDRFKSEMPDLRNKLELPKIEFGAEHDERMRRIEEKSEEDREERRRFHERLLSELERHNNVLERMLAGIRRAT